MVGADARQRRAKTKSPLVSGPSSDFSIPREIWSGRRGSNPRPRPWQGRALPLSYTRIREIGGDHAPATGRAMPNAHRECNSLRAVFEPAQSPDIGAIAGKSARYRPRTVAYLTGHGFREPGRPAAQRTRGAIRAIGRTGPEGSRSVLHDGARRHRRSHHSTKARSPSVAADPSEASDRAWNRLKFPGKPPLRCRELLNHHPGAC